MFTNRMRLTGFSGIDVNDMVTQIMRAESARLDRLRQNRDVLRWQQETFRGIATNINQFRSSRMSFFGPQNNNILSPDNWRALSPTVTSSGVASSAISVIAGSAAASGNHTLEVFQTAQADGIRSAATVNHNVGATTNGIDFSRFGSFDDAGVFTATGGHITLNVNGVSRNVQFSAAEIEGIMDGASLAALQGVWNQADARYNANVGDAIANAISEALAENPDLTTEQIEAIEARVSAEVRAEAMAHYSEDFRTAGSAATMSNFATALNTKLEQVFGNNPTGGQRVNATWDASSGEMTIRASNGNTATITGGTLSTTQLGLSENGSPVSSNFNINTSLLDFMGASAFTGGEGSIMINGQEITFTEDDTINNLMSRINQSGAGVRMSFSDLTGQFTMEATQTGATNRISMGDVGAGNFFYRAFGLTDTNLDTLRFREGQDSVIRFNGELMSRETNNFTVEGINIELSAASAAGVASGSGFVEGTGNTFNINLTADVTQTRQMIVDFVNAFNDLIRNIQDEVNTPRPRQNNSRNFFMPLTDAQRRAMSESEVRQWEEQARTGILHRDDVLRGLISDLRNSIFQNVQLEGGGTINLLDIGIRTSPNVADGAILHIDEAALDAALANRIEDVQVLFTRNSSVSPADTANRGQRIAESGVATRINDITGWAISTGGSIFQRAGVTENAFSHHENAISRNIRMQDDRIDAMIARLERREASLFAQFSRMETAMMRANSQMSFFDHLLFGGM